MQELNKAFASAASFPPLEHPTLVGFAEGIVNPRGPIPAPGGDDIVLLSLFEVKLRPEQHGKAVSLAFAGWLKHLRQLCWPQDAWFYFKLLHVGSGSDAVRLAEVLPRRGGPDADAVARRWARNFANNRLEPAVRSSGFWLSTPLTPEPRLEAPTDSENSHFVLFSWNQALHRLALAELRILFLRHVGDPVVSPTYQL